MFFFRDEKVHDENVADELTVSVFSKVLAKLDLYDENFQFKTWILTIAQNSVIDYWRKKIVKPKKQPKILKILKTIRKISRRNYDF
jgi:DNA-directed RNA polymerase specialized sigma24 family protein